MSHLLLCSQGAKHQSPIDSGVGTVQAHARLVSDKGLIPKTAPVVSTVVTDQQPHCVQHALLHCCRGGPEYGVDRFPDQGMICHAPPPLKSLPATTHTLALH
jgi:hypothetical protein